MYPKRRFDELASAVRVSEFVSELIRLEMETGRRLMEAWLHLGQLPVTTVLNRDDAESP